MMCMQCQLSWIIIFLAAIGPCLSLPAGASEKISNLIKKKDEGDTSLGRLPTALVPINYNVVLRPDIYTGAPPFLFNGSVDIRFECVEVANIVYLNSVGLVIENVDIVIATDSPVTGPDPVQIRWELDETLEFFKLFVDDNLLVGAEYIISLSFNGTMNPPSNGFGLYWGSYDNLDDGLTNYFAVTLFWPDSARQIFPCFDEPQMKATFDFTLLRMNNVVSLANTNSIGEEDRGGGWVAESFNTTVKMATYALCFVIGEFDYLESYSSRGTQVRVWSRPDYAEDLVYANQIAAGIQESHETWTGLDDPLLKMDHIAIPGFGGAMENWGLITYQESGLIYNETYNDLDDQRSVAYFISHEMAHMWFGNLVTFRWWNDAWLNEGFATFFENFPLDYYLNWGEETESQAFSSIRRIMDLDSQNTSMPVRVDIDSPWQGSQAFSTYTYNKGGAMLRMLQQILGEDTFQRGMRRYLNTHAYGSVLTDDFWDALTQQAEIDNITDWDGNKLFIKEKMDPWVEQRGYPIITLNRTASDVVDVTQTQFLSPIGQTTPTSPYQYEWYVPLTITNELQQDWSTDTKDWLNRENKSVSAGLPPSSNQWFIANVNQSGFYRTKYDSTTYSQLTLQLETDALVLPRETRFAMINDAVEITRAGLESEVFFFESTRGLDQEDTYVVWYVAELALRYPALILDRYPATDVPYEVYIRSKLDPTYSRLGWINNPADGNFVRSARALVLQLACFYNNTDCRSEATQQFQTWKADPSNNGIFVDHRRNVYCTGIQMGNMDDWNFLHSQYLSIADDPHRSASPEIDRILDALACSEDDTTLQRYINMTFDTVNFRLGDLGNAIRYIATSPRGRFVMYDNLKNNWMNDPIPPTVSKTSTLLDVVEGFATDQDLLELQSFISLNPPTNGVEQSAYDEALALVNTNNAWADLNEADLRNWFQAN